VAGWDRSIKDYAALGSEVLRLLEAIVSRCRCNVEYASPGQPRPRRFPSDPYRLLAVQGGLYCVGKVPAYRNFVTLAVDRIRSIELGEDSFTVDPAFDPKRYEAEAFGVAWEKPVTVVVRFSADQAPYVRERQWHPTQGGCGSCRRPGGADVPGGRDVRDHALGAELGGCCGGDPPRGAPA